MTDHTINNMANACHLAVVVPWWERCTFTKHL